MTSAKARKYSQLTRYPLKKNVKITGRRRRSEAKVEEDRVPLLQKRRRVRVHEEQARNEAHDGAHHLAGELRGAHLGQVHEHALHCCDGESEAPQVAQELLPVMELDQVLLQHVAARVEHRCRQTQDVSQDGVATGLVWAVQRVVDYNAGQAREARACARKVPELVPAAQKHVRQYHSARDGEAVQQHDGGDGGVVVSQQHQEVGLHVQHRRQHIKPQVPGRRGGASHLGV
eukprot:CAMPEP_0173236070 /NCGR_PEP_ID=MMETSP1142-20121109/11220_1 /TAXON_ID=483371 /ORGANISM="non described non described, Strain CCMP2298" /LENGTH=230 /DNA_ID=CAMNT_0014166467 /DNA_START=399 /DNA_END=1093 /DNA_ORIENTATION=-